MLAEPRSKRNYTLVPKGKPLYEDETRFGTKLMQKMGWTKGKGLGRDESGSKDFLRVRYKNDAKGLGFKARDDQWTQHEQSFNGLLNALNGSEEGENENLSKAKRVTSDESENEAPRLGFGFNDTTAREDVKSKVKKVAKLKEEISGISLEEKSKKSRARVHYQKFTRGKDLSQYSEKDLANIFGKKVGEESQNVNSQQEEPAIVNEEIKEENVQFLRTGISVSDYFKMKMQAKRNQLENGSNTKTTDTNGCTENNSANDKDQQKVEVFKKKNKRKTEKRSEDTENEEKLEKKEAVKKKKTKKSDLECENATEKDNKSTNFEAVEGQEKISKKNKKSKHKTRERFQPEEEEQLENELEGNVKENKRSQENEGKDQFDLTDEPKKKKQKKNKKDKDATKSDEKSIETKNVIGDQQASSEKQKKKTKNKKLSADHQEASKEPIKKSDKNKTKDVSYDNDVLAKDANSQEIKFDEIEKLHNSYNIYTISSFCAEKFRNLNFNDFNGSILSQIEGYGLSKDLQLEVHVNKNDEERITNLWKCVLDKYAHLEKPKKTYRHYVKEVIKARNMKQKRPKLYIKTWKRKNAFQII